MSSRTRTRSRRARVGRASCRSSQTSAFCSISRRRPRVERRCGLFRGNPVEDAAHRARVTNSDLRIPPAGARSPGADASQLRRRATTSDSDSSGDAVLNCVIAEALFERFPRDSGGRAVACAAQSLVNRDTLARVARRLSLSGEILRWGRRVEERRGRAAVDPRQRAQRRYSARLFVDGGYDAAARAAILRV